MSKQLAEESDKTKKLREKLRKHFELIDEQVTKQALERKISEIHRWIGRHAPHRVVLRSKTIALFDENQNAAQMSQRISNLMCRIQNEINT